METIRTRVLYVLDGTSATCGLTPHYRNVDNIIKCVLRTIECTYSFGNIIHRHSVVAGHSPSTLVHVQVHCRLGCISSLT